MAAMTSFHAEKCRRRLVSRNEATGGMYAAVPSTY